MIITDIKNVYKNIKKHNKHNRTKHCSLCSQAHK